MNTIQLTDNINNIYPLPQIPIKKVKYDAWEYDEVDCSSIESIMMELCTGNKYFEINEYKGSFDDKRFSPEQLEVIIAHRYKFIVKQRIGQYVVCANEDLQKVFKAVAEWLLNPQGKSSLLLYGRMGSGKSTMLKTIRSILTAERCDIKRMPALITAYDISHINPPKISDYIQANVLLIDDMGTEETRNSVYGVTFSPMIEVLSRRYDKQYKTIITSNLPLERIKEKYGDRIADRIKEEYKIIGFNSESYRGMEKTPDEDENSEVYLDMDGSYQWDKPQDNPQPGCIWSRAEKRWIPV